ncbi:MAG TPA: NAD-dependent epimerase/dehydratase family protein [Mucilaginibacter sp.]|jgi:UDP-2-acetamido-2,6-beta-L-arabino-hexul-4-ose reductase
MKIGITGNEGFIGKHLSNNLRLFPDEFQQIDFKKDYFKNQEKLIQFVESCDVIIHLAAMNRHEDPEVIFNTNVELVNLLIEALEIAKSKAHVIFSSSLQEERDNVYGKSKKKGRDQFTEWAKRSGGKFTGILIPNVFGPFGRPYYNSVIATFCHQLTNNEQPRIDVDGNLKLIYVGDLARKIIDEIRGGFGNNNLTIPHTNEIKVSAILNLLEGYKSNYLDSGIIPLLTDSFEINLFNTFRCYMDLKQRFPVKFVQHADQRGAFVELIKLNVGGQVSFSTTLSGITRGNHYHTRKIERFAVIKGEALIQLRRVGTNDIFNFYLSGESPAYVDMPIWYSHNIKNIGQDELYTVFWINEFFNPADPDTYFENV